MLAFIDIPIFFAVFVFSIILTVVPIWFTWRALDRAGLAGPLALIGLIPLGIFVVLGILAFAEWPNLQRTPPTP